ncbi:substrate-binding domain-containing protein [Paenarthrobacter sp. PH39-S1]|uniref:substrate-binding domain-containing protein n=1 Tax=Paenarthrobacter sp. PH39-S1 TaxID=3046204 RepID=UPI0032D8E7E0
MCANDRVAVGVLLACGRLRLRVPEDLSIVGYDDEPQRAGPARSGPPSPFPGHKGGRAAGKVISGALTRQLFHNANLCMVTMATRGRTTKCDAGVG